MGPGSVEKSCQFPEQMRATARETGSWFLDSNPYVQPGPADWMRFDADSHPALAKAMAGMGASYLYPP